MFIKNIILITGFIFCNVICSFAQDSQILPAGNKNLKIEAKFKFKENLINKFWQDRDDTDWEQELKYWKFGYLPKDDNSTPIVFVEENSLVKKENNYFRIFNGAKISIINPLVCDVQANLSFFVDSKRKNAKLFIGLNGVFIKDIILPSANNSTAQYLRVNLDNLDLHPGKNEIIFYDSLDCFHKAVFPRDLMVNIRDGFRSEIVSRKLVLEESFKNEYSQAIDDGSLNVLISRSESQDHELVLLSRDLDINIEEYPYLALDYKLGNMPAQAGVFLGVDFDEDSIIDVYLNLLGNEEANFLELAMNKWLYDGERQKVPKFYLKKIIIVFWDKDYVQLSNSDKNRYFSLKLDNFSSYSKKSIIVPFASYPVGDIKMAGTNCANYRVFLEPEDRNGQVLEARVFHTKLNFKESEVNSFSGNEFDKKNYLLSGNYSVESRDNESGRNEYMELNLPVNFSNEDKLGNLYFSFWYFPRNSFLEDLDIILDIDNTRVSVYKLGAIKDQTLFSVLEMRDGFYKIEVRLGRFGQVDLAKLKNIIFRYKRNLNFRGPGWKAFQMKDLIKFYFKYPVTMDYNSLQHGLLEKFAADDLVMLAIDGINIKCMSGTNNYPDIRQNQIIDLGHLRLGKGEHELKFFDNDLFFTEWARLSPGPLNGLGETKQDHPVIYFKKLNQAKYLVKITGAKSKFWLTFQQLFHPLWRVYLADDAEKGSFELIKEYKDLNANECRPVLKNDLFEFKYLYKLSLRADHLNANLYANTWFIDPQGAGLGENFVLVVYFWPQAFFNLGAVISLLTLVVLLLYFLFKFLRLKHVK